MPDVVRAVISGYYGYRNPGDEAILSVILNELRTAFPGVRVQVISGTPQETASTHGVEAILWSDPVAIAKAVSEADFVITGGGGILHDYGGFQEYGLLTEGNWGIGFHVTAGLLAALFGKPHFLYSVGVGPLFSEQARQFVRAIGESASLVTVRDEASAQLLAETGVDSSHIRVTADPAFLLEPAPEARLQEILRAEGLPPGSNRIAVAIRYWDQGVDPGVWEKAVAEALAQIRTRHNAQIVLIPFQHFPGQQEDDVAVAQRAANGIRGDSVFVLKGTYSPAEIAAVLGSSKLVLAMRLHAVIFALRAGRPFVALTYDRKVEEAVCRAGKPHLGIRMEDLSADRLVAAMELALNEPPADVRALQSLASATMEHLRAGFPGAAKPLSGPIVELVRNAIWSLVRSNAELRGWLREQKINYEYQVQVERDRAAKLEDRCKPVEGERDTLRAERDQLSAERDELRRNLASASNQLGVERSRSSALDRELQKLDSRHAELERCHRETVVQWETYFEELNRTLADYRSQKPWLAMLALRKGYVIFARQGFFAALRWTFLWMTGRGRIETEQLEFPPRPRPRD